MNGATNKSKQESCKEAEGAMSDGVQHYDGSCANHSQQKNQKKTERKQ